MLGSLKNAIKEFFCRIRNLRCRQRPGLNMSGTILILAPHPDDEALGCGGLIARLCANGNHPHVVIITGGGGSHRGCCNTAEEEIVAARRSLTRQAMEALDFPVGNLHELDYPDGDIGGAHPEQELQLRKLIDSIRPKTVLVPHHGEGWPDHLAVRELGLKLTPKEAEVYEYCVWMWYYRQRSLDWRNASCLRMTNEEHSRKTEAVRVYTAACAPCGKPWSGVLPAVFIKANSTATELFFKIK